MSVNLKLFLIFSVHMVCDPLGAQNKCFTEQKEGLQFMHPNGFNTEHFTN